MVWIVWCGLYGVEYVIQWCGKMLQITQKQKLQIFRTMGGRLTSDLEKHTVYRMVEFLVEVSKGRPGEKRDYYPYGEKAGRSTAAFRKCDFTNFAFTLCTIYAFIRCARCDPHHVTHTM